ncbi:MAG: hypothetical protein ACTHKU_17385, partial [Verrucomicrobiota bacterium]
IARRGSMWKKPGAFAVRRSNSERDADEFPRSATECREGVRSQKRPLQLFLCASASLRLNPMPSKISDRMNRMADAPTWFGPEYPVILSLVPSIYVHLSPSVVQKSFSAALR